MISLEKLKILTPLQNLAQNVGDLCQLIFAKGFKKLSKVQKNCLIWLHCVWPLLPMLLLLLLLLLFFSFCFNFSPELGIEWGYANGKCLGFSKAPRLVLFLNYPP